MLRLKALTFLAALFAALAAPGGAIAQDGASPIAKFGLGGSYRINSIGRPGYGLNNLANGVPELQRTKPDWESAVWEFEGVPGTAFVRIRNAWKGNYLLQSGGGPLAGSASGDTSHWVLEAAEGGPYYRIKGSDGRYLTATAGGLVLSEAPRSVGDGRWQFDKVKPLAAAPERRVPAPVPRVVEKPQKCRSGHVYSSSMKQCVPISATCTVGVEVYSPKLGKCVTKPVVPKGCEEGFKLVDGKCKKVTKKEGPQRCPPGTVPVPQTDNCVWKKDKQGFEVAPWKKPGCKGWQAACKSGNKRACAKYETTCQVN
jgi:uncharacterized protein YbdZ (MbtH family)